MSEAQARTWNQDTDQKPAATDIASEHCGEKRLHPSASPPSAAASIGDREGPPKESEARTGTNESAGDVPETRSNKRVKIAPPRSDLEPDPVDPNDLYYIKNGSRRVRPYYYVFKSHAKGRWFGRTIYDVLVTEFRDRDAEYYRKAIETGMIRVNDKKVGLDAVFKNGDTMLHKTHRHEPPVTATSIEIVEETDDGILVINKPASIPVHPSGRFAYNSIVSILKHVHGYKKLHPANRLDRLTSGLMVLGLTTEKARELEEAMRTRKVQKEYIARVVGEFPEEQIVCNESIKTIDHKLGLNCVDRVNGKECRTLFKRIWYDGTHSLVLCKPKTGRTHQIRVHLQFLGHPIANDPLYSNPSVWGENLGKDGVEYSEDEHQEGRVNVKDVIKLLGEAQKAATRVEAVEDEARVKDALTNVPIGFPRGMSLDPDQPFCPECGHAQFTDPSPDQLQIYLHAYRYSGPGWTFRTSVLPGWIHKLGGDRSLLSISDIIDKISASVI